MARKCRVEFPGAFYHAMNRGNYKSAIFSTDGAKHAFEECLFEAAVKAQWILHAFQIMLNHFHLLVETPLGNLVAGMQWLESTFGNRFNRFRGEHGHLFQGRYKAILLEPGTAVGPVADYIHLNPVRAGQCTVETLGRERHGSYWYLQRPQARPPFLRFDSVLAGAGDIPDTPSGRRVYADHLAWQITEGPLSDPQVDELFCTGWALGAADFLEDLLRNREPSEENRAWERGGAQEIREARWSDLLARCLEALGSAITEPDTALKTAPWKVAIATFLKGRTLVSNGWLASQLHMGNPVHVSALVGKARRDTRLVQPWLQILQDRVEL